MHANDIMKPITLYANKKTLTRERERKKKPFKFSSWRHWAEVGIWRWFGILDRSSATEHLHDSQLRCLWPWLLPALLSL